MMHQNLIEFLWITQSVLVIKTVSYISYGGRKYMNYFHRLKKTKSNIF